MASKLIINKNTNKYNVNLLISDNYNDKYLNFLSKIYNIKSISTFSDFLKAYIKGEYKINYNLIVFTGGEDVSPALYGEKKHPLTICNHERDKIEEEVYKIYEGSRVKKIGICRGAQFLTVMNGGKLIQHVENHTESHPINSTVNNKNIVLEMTSTHHQMMYPFNIPQNRWDLIAWSKYFKSNTYSNGDEKEIDLPESFLEPEILYYKNVNSLCIQGHPESDDCDEKTKDYIYRLMQTLL